MDKLSYWPRALVNRLTPELFAGGSPVECWTKDSWQPSSQLIEHKASGGIWAPGTRAHLQGSSGVHTLTGQSCFGGQSGATLYRQVVLLLCLMGVSWLISHTLFP